MLLVVCDSTPLIYLTRIGRFSLLHELHETVLIPPAVWDEVRVKGAAFPESRELEAGANQGWIRVERPKGKLSDLAGRENDLDPGESEAIQLAIEHNAMLAIDESLGRAVAARLGVKLTGTVGLLVRARRERRIAALRPELDRLRATTFRVSEVVYLEALKAVNESAE